jgi:hypothetical protein
MPASITVDAPAAGAGRWFGGARPDPAALTLGDPPCGNPGIADPLRVVYGDCQGWIGVTTSGAVYEGNPSTTKLAPPVGEALSLVARGDQVIVGGREGVARRVWVAGRPGPDAWAAVPRPDALGAVAHVDALATAVRADLWFADPASLCHSDGGPPACAAIPDIRSLAAHPQGAWAVDNKGGLWLVSPNAGPKALSGHEAAPPAGGTLQAEARALDAFTPRALVYDGVRGVLWAAGDAAVVALDPATGAEKGRWAWSVGAPEALALESGGLRVFGPTSSQLAQFGF